MAQPQLQSDGRCPAYAIIDYDDAYVEPKIVSAVQKCVTGISTIRDASKIPKTGSPKKVLNWSAYEKIDFDQVMENPEGVLCCSYIIRKALIRKHHLALTVRHHVAKHPNSVLTSSFPETCDFELDFAEFLDEALVEAYEVRQSLTENEGREPNERAWWILKPGMSDRGQGIRLFSTIEELTEIFESFEEDSDADEEDEGEGGDTSVVTSQLRHFVAQKYLHPPLLVGNRKFHIRAYVLAVGGLKVYVYRRMLALFAAKEYSPPWENGDLAAHLTNTCLQTGERDGSVRLFWDLEKEIGKERLQAIWEEVCKTVGETFEGAARGQRVHFQPLPNAFEIFGVDFILSADGQVYLLEVNAYPDFKQTGEELSEVISGLLEDTVRIAVAPFFGAKETSPLDDMERVLDIELGSW